MPPQKRLAPERGGLESPDGGGTRPAQIADGFVFDMGNRDGREGPRAHEPRPGAGVTPVGCDPVARLFRKPGRGDAPARRALCTHGARAPIPARAGFGDTDQRFALGLQLPDELVEVALARADGAQKDHFGPVILGHVGDRHRRFVDIHSDRQGGRMGQG
jgi:hypothetical protein